jgi:hypothetical protein
MRKFNVANDFAGSLAAMSTTIKTLLGLSAATATLRRGRIVEIGVGPISSPVANDCNIIYQIQRFTAAGTSGASATPAWVGTQEAGSDTPVAGCVVGVNTYTVEPTYTANTRLWTKALNQHSGFIWYSPDEMGLPWPAVNANGLGCGSKCVTADFTGNVLWEVKHEE